MVRGQHHIPAALSPEIDRLHRRLGGPQGRSNSQEFDPRTFYHIASRYEMYLSCTLRLLAWCECPPQYKDRPAIWSLRIAYREQKTWVMVLFWLSGEAVGLLCERKWTEHNFSTSLSLLHSLLLFISLLHSSPPSVAHVFCLTLTEETASRNGPSSSTRGVTYLNFQSAVVTISTICTNTYFLLGKFHPFYRPQGPLGRVQV
jgi:hypothetical protein